MPFWCVWLFRLFHQGGGCDPYFVVKITNGVLKDFTVYDYRLHVPKKKVRADGGVWMLVSSAVLNALWV